MKKLFGCLLLLGFSALLLAQQRISFSVYGGPLYAQPSVDTIYSTTFTISMSDSTGFWRVPATSITNINAIGTIGFKLGGSIHFPISDKLNIRTGIDLRNQAFRLESEFLGVFPDENGVAEFVPIQTGSGFGTTCDDFSSIGDINNTPHARQYDMLHLNIPIDLELQLLQYFTLNAGLRISTPIWTNFRSIRGQYTFDTSILDDGTEWTICTIEYNDFNDHSGNNFNNLVLGTQLGIGYQIKERLAIGLNISGSLNSLFVNNQLQLLFSASGIQNADTRFLNRAVSLDVRYSGWGYQSKEKLR